MRVWRAGWLPLVAAEGIRAAGATGGDAPNHCPLPPVAFPHVAA